MKRVEIRKDCPICDLIFDTSTQYLAHLFQRHPMPPPDGAFVGPDVPVTVSVVHGSWCDWPTKDK